MASGTSGREMGWQRIKSENAGDSTLDRKERKMKRKRKRRTCSARDAKGDLNSTNAYFATKNSTKNGPKMT